MVDLTLIEEADSDDILYHRSYWAAFFKAATWEELFMLVEQSNTIATQRNTIDAYRNALLKAGINPDTV